MQKTKCFISNLRELYPNMSAPNEYQSQEWQKILSPLNVEDIISTLKSWVKKSPKYPPTPQKFQNHLKFTSKPQTMTKQYLPFSPESYLMRQDIENNRCKHFYPTYCNAVRYLLNVKLKTFYKNDEFKNFNYSKRYQLAVERGLFADFDQTLDFVASSGEYYD